MYIFSPFLFGCLPKLKEERNIPLLLPQIFFQWPLLGIHLVWSESKNYSIVSFCTRCQVKCYTIRWMSKHTTRRGKNDNSLNQSTKLFRNGSALWVLWNSLTGHLLCKTQKSTRKQEIPFSILLPSGPGRSSKSQPASQHRGSYSLHPLPPLPWNRHICRVPRDKCTTRDYEHPSALESIKCSTGGRLSWLKIWSVFLCVSSESQECIPWGGKKLLARFCILLTAELALHLMSSFFWQSFCNSHGDDHPERC